MSTVDTGSTIRTFYPRRGRVSQRHETAVERLYPRLGVTLRPGESLDHAAVFGRVAPLVVEIGTGMGDTTVDMAAADPDRDYLGIEVHLAGIGNLLDRADREGVSNLRIFDGDALTLFADHLADVEVDTIHLFFPDPWPKVRHRKRRMIRPDRLAVLRSRLRVGGTLWCATDWADYAEVMLATLTADPGLENRYDGYAPRPDERPVTKFEQRGVDAGRVIRDLIFTRVA
ncbi:tRNA (guanosine(46)-N7)-methyltransferase TrmB [Stackebrandtia soli]|uniref:tRNA (guanosine(46)-N7)-methyltransferase TrmB n=1 Tax=Stackebrandtia soli TaxID=1892856 RepID=UPI0039EBA28C